MVSAIEIEHMSKKFGDRKILEDITMSIGQGDAISFIGHNGCGKSTMLKIIGKFLTYDEGKITYQKNLRLGYVPEHFPKLAITPRQYIKSVGRVQQMKQAVLEQRSRQLFHDFFMEDMIDTPIKLLSKGTIQKVAVLQAVLEKPDILLLDEPLSGQDTDSQKVFIQMMQEMNKEGMTIVMSCHEEWLLKAISKAVYEIKDKHLVKSDKLEKRS